MLGSQSAGLTTHNRESLGRHGELSKKFDTPCSEDRTYFQVGNLPKWIHHSGTSIKHQSTRRAENPLLGSASVSSRELSVELSDPEAADRISLEGVYQMLRRCTSQMAVRPPA